MRKNNKLTVRIEGGLNVAEEIKASVEKAVEEAIAEASKKYYRTINVNLSLEIE